VCSLLVIFDILAPTLRKSVACLLSIALIAQDRSEVEDTKSRPCLIQCSK
jgi:hypothetical protein